MMELLNNGTTKKNNSKKIKEEFEACLRGDDEEKDVDYLIDEQMRHAT